MFTRDNVFEKQPSFSCFPFYILYQVGRTAPFVMTEKSDLYYPDLLRAKVSMVFYENEKNISSIETLILSFHLESKSQLKLNYNIMGVKKKTMDKHFLWLHTPIT